ncbi:MAG: PLP-dependent aspartate aminotransferase family protein [Thermomicrobiales bacterium]
MTSSPIDFSSASVETQAIHAGERTTTGNATPTVNAIQLSTAFSYPDTAELDEVFSDPRKGYVYSRHGSPNVQALEEAVATLEHGGGAVAYGSGMAAINAAITYAAGPGDTVLASQDIYGAVYATLNTHFRKYGIVSEFVDILDLETVRAKADALKPKAILLESVSNPLLRVADIAAVAEIAYGVGAILIVDNTFATPIVTRPLDLGADLVVHSTTKFISGHGDVTGGIIVTSVERTPVIREENRLSGAIPSPFDSWLSLRGVKTLPLRMRKHCRNASSVAAWLADDPRVSHVNYPSLNETLPEGQFIDDLHGAMLSFDIVDAGREQIFAFLDNLSLIQSATTLGDVYTLSLYPAISSHRGYTPEQRHAIGIGDGLVRLSVGIEGIADILADLDVALTAATGRTR